MLNLYRMRPSPYRNALFAIGYICGVALLIRHISSLHKDSPDNLVGTIAFLSLLVCSVATMAFLFFYRPLALLIDGKGNEAVTFFLRTLGTFALITLLVLLTVV